MKQWKLIIGVVLIIAVEALTIFDKSLRDSAELLNRSIADIKLWLFRSKRRLQEVIESTRADQRRAYQIDEN